MTPDTDALLRLCADLATLTEQATAGPWRYEHGRESHYGGKTISVLYNGARGDPLGTYGFTEVNAALIVAAVNALPTLLAAIPELVAQVARYEDRQYATVYERTAWNHDIGAHKGSEFPYSYCPRCEVEHPLGRLAQAEAERDALIERLAAAEKVCQFVDEIADNDDIQDALDAWRAVTS